MEWLPLSIEVFPLFGQSLLENAVFSGIAKIRGKQERRTHCLLERSLLVCIRGSETVSVIS